MTLMWGRWKKVKGNPLKYRREKIEAKRGDSEAKEGKEMRVNASDESSVCVCVSGCIYMLLAPLELISPLK